jgi:hypothetical protein
VKDTNILLVFLAASVNGSLDHLNSILPLSDEQWEFVFEQSILHRVCGLVCTVIEKLPPEHVPPKELLLQFIGSKLQQLNEYDCKFRVTKKYAETLSERGVKMVILKGIAFGSYYEEPSLRDFGDCDCYLGEQQSIGDEVCVQMGGIVEHGTYKHSHLFIDNLLIENHRYFTDFNGTKKGRLIESILEKELYHDDNTYIGDTPIICPNPRFNALFLLKHHLTDFLEEGIILRMIYDWTILLYREQNNIEWDSLYEEMDSIGLRNFADVLTSISVRYLGLKLTNKAITLSSNNNLVNDVITDTLTNTNRMEYGESVFHKIIRISSRFKRMWHYRTLAYETYPVMVLNSFIFCYSVRKVIKVSR